jgi:YrbI family 3-deoxy-D-manno-octulosonate 8-phosphate phosphatase
MIIALIPLTDSSKSIPNKNIKIISGKSLYAWVFESARASNIFDKILIATDSNEIIEVIKNLKLPVEIIRYPAELVKVKLNIEELMLDISKKYNFDLIFTIKATFPLTTANDFKNAYKLFVECNFDSLLTGVRIKKIFWSLEGTPFNYKYMERPISQDFNYVLMENNAFYITKRSILENKKCILGGKIGIYEMLQENSIEVDESGGWEKVEKELDKRNKLNIKERLSDIKMLVMDVDGVLTDGGMYYSEKGDELKKFNTKDGKAIELLKNKGVKVAIITSEKNNIIKRRMDKLKVDFLIQGSLNKKLDLLQLSNNSNIPLSQIAYVGDDINDIEAIKIANVSFCPQDAVEEIKNNVNFILKSNGGEAVIREIWDVMKGVN